MDEKNINIGLSDKERTAVANLLKPLLADVVALYFATRGAHWNVVGPHFGPLHKFFQDQYELIDEEMDQVAERLRSLGVAAPSQIGYFVEKKRIDDSAGDAPNAMTMLKALLESNESLIRVLRDDVEACDKNGDQGTADFLTGLMEAHEKNAWMIRAHIE